MAKFILSEPREPFKSDTAYMATGAIEGAFRVFSSQWKSDPAFRSTLSGRRYSMIFPVLTPKKKPNCAQICLIVFA